MMTIIIVKPFLATAMIVGYRYLIYAIDRYFPQAISSFLLKQR